MNISEMGNENAVVISLAFFNSAWAELKMAVHPYTAASPE